MSQTAAQVEDKLMNVLWAQVSDIRDTLRRVEEDWSVEPFFKDMARNEASARQNTLVRVAWDMNFPGFTPDDIDVAVPRQRSN